MSRRCLGGPCYGRRQFLGTRRHGNDCEFSTDSFVHLPMGGGMSEATTLAPLANDSRIVIPMASLLDMLT